MSHRTNQSTEVPMKGWTRWLLLGAAVGAAAAWGVARAATGSSTARRPEPTVQEEAAALAPRITPAMIRYSSTRYALYFVGVALDLAVLGLFLRTGAAAGLRDRVERRARRPVLRTLFYFLGFSLAFALLTAPLLFYGGWWLPHQYDLSNQSLPAWLWDRLKEAGIGFGISAPLVVLLYVLIRRQPRRWWLWFWLLSIPVTLALVLVAPVLLDPVFHNYQPLRDTALRDRILALAAKAGIEGGRVYQVDMSRETKTLNAYVTGLGRTKRIVLWDTTLERLKPDEILFIMGHEMAHYVYNHVYWGVALSIGGTLVLLILVDGLSRRAIARWGRAWGVRDLGDLASLPVLMAVLTVLQFLGMPFASAVSRTMEAQADRFGLQITGDGRAAARAFVKFSEQNLSLPSPPPFIRFWLYTHPTLSERISTALAWDREHSGGS
jgi:STE24 endopeptidase